MALSTSVTARSSLYAAFNTKTGEVLGKTAERHTSAEFVAFLTDIVINQPRGKEIHVIADNLSAHKSQPVKDFLASASEGSPALHSDLLLVAQPGRAVVRQDRTRCHRPRRVHFRLRPEEKAHALHPPLQQIAPNREVEVRRSIPTHQYTISWYRPLVALEVISSQVEKALGVKIEIVGFDTGNGLPAPRDYRDLPHLWEKGFYEMDQDMLRARLRRAQLVLGDISETSREWLRSDHAPIGFVAFDLDYYSSTKAAFALFEGDAGSHLPRVLLLRRRGRGSSRMHERIRRRASRDPRIQ